MQPRSHTRVRLRAEVLTPPQRRHPQLILRHLVAPPRLLLLHQVTQQPLHLLSPTERLALEQLLNHPPLIHRSLQHPLATI